MREKSNKCAVISIAFVVILSIIPGLLFAADLQESVKVSQTATSTEHVLKTMLGLIAVLALIFAIAWLVRNYFGFSTISGSMVKMVAGVSVGQKERVVLLQVGDRQMLVGVAPGNVSLLHLLEQGSELHPDENTVSSFADKLKRSINKIEKST